MNACGLGDQDSIPGWSLISQLVTVRDPPRCSDCCALLDRSLYVGTCPLRYSVQTNVTVGGTLPVYSESWATCFGLE